LNTAIHITFTQKLLTLGRSEKMTSPAAIEPAAYPPLAPKLLLISTKAYFTPSRSIEYLNSLLDHSNGILPLKTTSQPGHNHPPTLQLALLPDFLALHPSASILAAHSNSADPTTWPLLLGAQNCFWEPHPGAYTGEIVPSSLRALGCSVVELGHAEQRRPRPGGLLSETNETVAQKAAAVCACGMIPLVCVGEAAAPARKGPMSMAVGDALREIAPQLVSVLEAVPADAPLIVAYEPVWAIGRERPAAVEYVGPVVQGIREVVRKVAARTGETRVVYGGSAGPGLWGKDGLGKCVDGLFLGRFAHEIGSLKEVVGEVVESIENTKKKR
jgi:triosephosphate isomerase (TIM)